MRMVSGQIIGTQAVFFGVMLYLLFLTINLTGMFLHAMAVWAGLDEPSAYIAGVATCQPDDNWVCKLGEEEVDLLGQYVTSIYW